MDTDDENTNEHDDAPIETAPLPQLSPLHSSRELLDFGQAMERVASGGTITKLEWGNENTVARLHPRTLQICLKGEWSVWAISDGDLGGQDYYVVHD